MPASEHTAMTVYTTSHKHLDLWSAAPYQPLFVGAYRCPEEDRQEDWCYDDSRQPNISTKNETFCELTGLHWIWNNNKSDITGLVHYRRFPRATSSAEIPLSEDEIKSILASHDCIVNRRIPCVASGTLCSVAEQYRICHSSTDLVLTDMVIKRYFKKYYSAFQRTIKKNYFCPCNILICKKEVFDHYCQWLFGVESRLEEYIDPYRDRDTYQQRVFGFIAERLLNVYIEAEGLHAFECSVFDPANPDTSYDLSMNEWNIRNTLNLEESREPSIMNGLDYSRVFDYRFYMDHNPDLAANSISDKETAFWHFLEYGISEKRMAHPCFSIDSYMRGNPGFSTELGADPKRFLEHYLNNPQQAKHVVGYENMQPPQLPQENDCQTYTHRTCSGRKIRPQALTRRLQKAEERPVLD